MILDKSSTTQIQVEEQVKEVSSSKAAHILITVTMMHQTLEIEDFKKILTMEIWSIEDQ